MIAPRDEKGRSWPRLGAHRRLQLLELHFTWNPYAPLGVDDRDDNEVHMEVVPDG